MLINPVWGEIKKEIENEYNKTKEDGSDVKHNQPGLLSIPPRSGIPGMEGMPAAGPPLDLSFSSAICKLLW